jgi:hypothetical protein
VEEERQVRRKAGLGSATSSITLALLQARKKVQAETT